jgi:hypothetical protein
MDKFIQWATANPVAHIEAAYAAWQAQQVEIDRLRVEVLTLRERVEHLEQKVFEARNRRLRLVG